MNLKLEKSELLGISGIIVFIILLLLVGSQFDLGFINEYVESAGIWAPIAFILAKSSTLIIAPLSGTPLYVLVGTLFGVGEGILYAFLGDLLGFSVLFFLSRRYGLRIINKLTNDNEIRLIKTIQKYTSDVRSFIKVALTLFWFPEVTMIAVGLGNLKYITVMTIFMPIFVLFTSLIIFISTNVVNL